MLDSMKLSSSGHLSLAISLNLNCLATTTMDTADYSKLGDFLTFKSMARCCASIHSYHWLMKEQRLYLSVLAVL